MKTRKFQAAALAAAFAFAFQARSAELTLPREGWASWQVDAADGAPAMCCWNSWNVQGGETQACELDGNRQGYGTQNHATTGTMRIYARFANGKVDRLRAFAASCPVQTKSPIQKLDNVATDDSARWLIGLTKQNYSLTDDVLVALATHRGDIAFDGLSAVAHGDANIETRKHAIFWLANVRGEQGAQIVSSIMFNDKNAEIREHAAFAITMSKSPHVADDLTKLGNTDKDGHVREQAWFWLARTGASVAEQTIAAAIKNDADEHVREQAVFALSQLPGERATAALIAAAQDKSLSKEQRKRAVFWLAHSDAPGAQSFLEKTLVQSTP